MSFIGKVPATFDLYECLLKDGAAAEKSVLIEWVRGKRNNCISYASERSSLNNPRSPCQQY